MKDKIPSPVAFPFMLPAVRQMDRLELHPQVTFLVGENGSGKSTILEAIAVAWGFNAEGGSQNFNFSTRSSHSDLNKYLRLVKGVRRPRSGYFLRAESFYNVASEIDRLEVNEGYDYQSLHAQSHGESFLALLMHRFHGNGFYPGFFSRKIRPDRVGPARPRRGQDAGAEARGCVSKCDKHLVSFVP